MTSRNHLWKISFKTFVDFISKANVLICRTFIFADLFLRINPTLMLINSFI